MHSRCSEQGPYQVTSVRPAGVCSRQDAVRQIASRARGQRRVESEPHPPGTHHQYECVGLLSTGGLHFDSESVNPDSGGPQPTNRGPPPRRSRTQCPLKSEEPYSSGALSRWRTLHEVWVVFVLLADGDEDLSRRYLAHEVVESLKGQEEYEETWDALGHEPPDWTAAEREQTRAELAAEFDGTFLVDYGWAAKLFNGKAPKFRQLQESAELDHWRGCYRMASHGTHANPKGISWNIQDLSPTDWIWAGPSNAGLVEPAQYSLIALAGLTASLIGYAFSELPDSAEDGILDQSETLVRLQAIGILRDLAIETLGEVHAEQEAEEEALADLVGRATTVLRQGAPTTAERLAAELDVDIEELAEALDGAVARGELFQEKRYRMEATDDETSEGVAPG